MNGKRAKAIRNMLGYDPIQWRDASLQEKYQVDRSTDTIYCRGKRREYQLFKKKRRERL